MRLKTDERRRTCAAGAKTISNSRVSGATHGEASGEQAPLSKERGELGGGKRSFPTPETKILKEILLALGQHPDLRVWRNNTGMLWSGAKVRKVERAGMVKAEKGDILIKSGYPVRFGLPGSADILGLISPSGRLIAIEVKTETGKQSEQQKAFAKMIKRMGGVYILARSADEAVKKLEPCGAYNECGCYPNCEDCQYLGRD